MIPNRLLIAVLCCLLLGAGAVYGDPPGSGFNVDTQDRFHSRWFYNIVYQSSEGTDAHWTGNVAGCVPGSTSDAFKGAVIRRVNYFRAMAGAPATVALNGSFSSKAQEAALMMSAQGAISHHPGPGWACYSAAGDEAAASSNLSLGNSGWDAVTAQVRDNGANNAAVGHRRWILYPQTREMGTGDIPGDTNWTTNVLWVFDDHFGDSRPRVRDGFVAWPPPGYVPHEMVFPRWSFSYPNADFSGASVSLLRNGMAVDLRLETVGEGFGENTLVWIPEDLNAEGSVTSWPRPDEDIRYEVTVGGVRVGGQLQQPFSYRVTVIDPLAADPAEVQSSVDGPFVLGVFGTGRYEITAVPRAAGYEWRYGVLDDTPWLEGAEGGGIDVIDGTSGGYPLVTTDLSATGSASFHLAHVDPVEQSFRLTPSIVPGPGSELVFSSRLGWATEEQVVRAQISLDDGINWQDLWEQYGTDDAGERDFVQRRISLGDYTGRSALFRFTYGLDSSYFSSADRGVGFYVDDIRVTGASRADSWVSSAIGSQTRFDFAPVAEGEYGLQARPLLWEGFPGTDWGPVLPVSAVLNCGATAKDWVYKAYVGYYARCPDQAGMFYWCDRLTREGGGTDLGPIIAAFGTSKEYSDRFSGLSDAELIGNLYLNMFDRAAEPDGLAFYLRLLEQWRELWRADHGGSNEGATEYALSRIALDVLNGARGGDLVTLNAKIAVCPVY